MNQSREAKNKALVLEAFETLFNRHDGYHQGAVAEGAAAWAKGPPARTIDTA